MENHAGGLNASAMYDAVQPVILPVLSAAAGNLDQGQIVEETPGVEIDIVTGFAGWTAVRVNGEREPLVCLNPELKPNGRREGPFA